MASLDTKFVVIVAVFISTASSQILTPSNVAENQKFTINCDANKVTIPEPNLQDIIGLFIYRTTSQDNKQIASYVVNPPAGVKPNGTDLPGRNYTFTPSGAGTGINNKATMKIQLDINSAICSDAGEYRCDVQYFSGMYKTASYSQNLTAETGVTTLMLKPDPNFETIDVPKESLYPEGINVTLTCSFYGPNNTKVSWRYSTDDPSIPSSIQPYPTANDISDSNPVLQGGSTGCPRYYITSVLKPSEISKTFKTTYYCIISDGRNQQLASDNYTIGIRESMTPEPGAATAGSSDTDVGMIVGIVIGCVALIIIIVVIIVVCRLRKKKGDADKGDRTDGNTESNLHAPPPVFYPTKQSKDKDKDKDTKISAGMTNEALDNSYDSRDSANKGPPRYANTDPESQGPPRYEKESHRGRQNRGYDDENGGHGRRQPREREDRKHRSRDYDEDQPRSRYSTDDGTDSRGMNMGDPNMGTSI